MARRFINTRFVRVLLVFASFPMSQALAQGVAPVAPPTGGKKALTIADYARWRNVEGAEISPDGKWVAYTLRYMNTLPAESRPALRILNLDTNQDIEVPNAHSASFSADSRWVVYQLDSVPARGGRGGGNAAPTADTSAVATAPGAQGTPPQAGGRGGAGTTSVPPRVELRELATGRTQSWQRMQTGDFNYTATHLLMRRRAGAAGAGAGRGARTRSFTNSRRDVRYSSGQSVTSPSTVRATCSPIPSMPSCAMVTACSSST